MNVEGAARERHGMLLVVEDLHTRFELDRGVVQAVSGSSFSVDRGETLGIVGESGSGKSVTVRSILRLIRPPGRIASGRVLLNGVDLLALDERAMTAVRGREISMVFPGAVGRPQPGADGGRADLGGADHAPGDGERTRRASAPSPTCATSASRLPSGAAGTTRTS